MKAPSKKSITANREAMKKQIAVKESATETPVEVTMEEALAEEKASVAAQDKADKANKAAQVKAEKEAKKEAEKAAKEEAKAKAKAEKETAKPVKEKYEYVTQNGVRRPKSGTKCGQVWDMADTMSKEKASPISLAELMVVSDKEGWNKNNTSGEYSLWRKFYGITGRIANPASADKSVKKLEDVYKKASDRLNKAQVAFNAAYAALEAAKNTSTPVEAEAE